MEEDMKGLGVALVTLSVILALPVVATANDNHCGAKGTYAYTGFGNTFEGNLLGFPVGVVSTNGTITLDGNGNAFIREAEVVNGVLLNAAAEFTGTYTLSPDCTFTAMLNGVPIPVFVGVVADNGKQIRAMSTIPGIQVNYTNTVRVHP
jgi:hypothetical protein